MERSELSYFQKIRDFLIEKFFCCCDYPLHRFHPPGYPKNWLKVERAAEPDEIIWENLGYSDRYRFIAKCKTFLLSFFVLIFCFALIFGISYLQVP